MEQQQAHFDESTSYTTGYEERSRTNDDFPDAQGQKLSPPEHLMSPTARQRLLLAIVSLVILFLALLAINLLATYSTPNSMQFGIVIFLVLFVAAIVVNVKFNHKR